MKTLVRAMLAILLTGMGLSVAADAAPPPVEAFGRKPALVDVAINPSGTRLAWIEDDGTPHLVIHDLATASVMRNIRAPEKTKLWKVTWANDDTVLLRESVTQSVRTNQLYTDEWRRWVAVDARGGGDRLLLMRDPNREWVNSVRLLRARSAIPGKVFMASWDFSETNYKQETGSRLAGGRKDSGWIYSAYEVDVRSGEGRIIANGTPFTNDWLLDADAKNVVRSDYDPTHDDFSIAFRNGLVWRQIYRAKCNQQLSLLTFNADRSAVIAEGRGCDDDRNKIWSIPLDGSGAKTFFEDPKLEVDGVHLDDFDDTLLGVTLGGMDQDTRWLDSQAERRSIALHKSFSARWVTTVSRSADNQRVVVLVEDEKHPPIYYLVDFAAKKADGVNDTYPLLSGVTLGDVSNFEYTSRDNYPLLAYLTIPPGAAKQNLPLVVMPHGGPQARDEPGFDWLAQFLASRGYAVVQPQFRGSTGFGRAHEEAGLHQWGLRMQDDVSDAVTALVSQHIADPKRVCIVGWSYGGYAALAGATFTPELYSCAVSIGGISDLPDMVRWATKNAGGRDSDTFKAIRETIGAPDDPNVVAKSPVSAAARVRAPVLLIHGTDDTIVPLSQSQRMVKALTDAGKSVEFVQLQGEDHWMATSSASRIRTLTELERFLGKYLGSSANEGAAGAK